MPHRLRGSRNGDDAAATLICEHHSGALFSLACVLLPERETAESVVVQVVADACTNSDLDGDHGSLRRHLARLTYQQCVARSATATIDPKQASLALVTVGDHTYQQAAEVLGLSGETVAGLLTDALRAAKQPVR